MSDPLSLDQIAARAVAAGALQIPAELHALATFVRGLAPRNILEIGTARGGSFSVWCALASRVAVSIDLPHDPSRLQATLGIRREEQAAREALFRSWSPSAVALLADSQSPEALNGLVAALDGEPLDFLFLDGDHSFLGVAADFTTYARLVRPGGWIALHDIEDNAVTRSPGRQIFVADFWRHLRGLKIEIRAGADWGGIGLIQV